MRWITQVLCETYCITGAACYIRTMIRSFKCKETKALYDGERTRHWQDVRKVAFRKLDMLNAAKVLTDLTRPPGNRLEALSGNRLGQHSIRINDQWRICFRWTEEPEDVEIVDYH